MRPLSFTLLSEGSSDRALIPILVWTLKQHSSRAFTAQWADLRKVRRPLRGPIERLRAGVQLYPCDLLFVHRDGNAVGLDARKSEIASLLIECPAQAAVAVVPVRALEAWLLIDEKAIRAAAGNPNGEEDLDLPAVKSLERLADPKQRLRDLLRTASGLGARRRRSFRTAQALHRISDLVEDFDSLRMLPAFSSFEMDLRRVLTSHGWT